MPWYWSSRYGKRWLWSAGYGKTLQFGFLDVSFNGLKETAWANSQKQENIDQQGGADCKNETTLNTWARLKKWWHDHEQILPPFRRVDGCKVKKADTGLSIHVPADSLFSTTSGFNDFRGFLNLALLLLVISSARVALENVIKYGILVDPFKYIAMLVQDPQSVPCIAMVLACNVFIIFAFTVEKFLSTNKISENVGFVLHFINLAMVLLVPSYRVLTIHPNPVFSSVALGLCLVVFLKLISYVQTNKWCRLYYKKHHTSKNYIRSRQKSLCIPSSTGLGEGAGDASSGNNNSSTVHRSPDKRTATIETWQQQKLSLKDLYYFIVVPTLCYEKQFPRSERLRKRFLIKRLLESVFITGLVLALVQQWILPLINNALVPFSKMQWAVMMERILKLALPNFCIWLLWFYVTFHSVFNVVAEVFRFADRTFYDDWWNAETVTEFWQKWNIPVHRWAVRHLYKPMLKAGYSKLKANTAVFIVSAVFHEFLCSVPLGMIKLYAFFGMLCQIPLAVLTAKLHPVSPKLCNVIVWCSLLLGQPVAVLMYYVDYYMEKVAVVH